MSSLQTISPKLGARDLGPVRASALCLTGGGVLGRYTIEVLIGLQGMRERALGAANGYTQPIVPLRFAFDLVAGTSVGALIAAAVVRGADLRNVAEVIEANGPKIFPEKSTAARLSHIRTAWFSNDFLISSVEEILGDGNEIRLGELDTHIAIPALNEATGQPTVYTSLDRSHEDLKLKDVVLASASAPLYLPSHKIEGDRHIDGGLFSNAPDLSAISLLKRAAPVLKLEALSMVSIGTTAVGTNSPAKPGDDGNWGLGKWLAYPVPGRLIKLIIAAQTAHTIEIVKSLPLDHYIRIDTELDNLDAKILEMDNASPTALKRLRELGESRLETLSEENSEELFTIIRRAKSPNQPIFQQWTS